MASLLDIAPARETVTVGGVALELRAITAADIVVLMQRFGNVFGILSGDSAAVRDLKPAIGAVIAAANGGLGNAEEEKAGAELGLGDQARIIAAIRRLTMPQGVRPFVEDLAALGLPLGDFLVALDGISAPASPAPSSA